MMVFPTTTLDWYSGQENTEVDEYGDEQEGTTPRCRALPASVVEDGQQRFAPADLRAELVEQFTIRLHGTVDVREGDRLVDNTTGATYQVHGVSKPQGMVGFPTTRLITRRVGVQP